MIITKESEKKFIKKKIEKKRQNVSISSRGISKGGFFPLPYYLVELVENYSRKK